MSDGFLDPWPARLALLHGAIAALLARALPEGLAAALADPRGLIARRALRAALAWLRSIERLVRVLIILSALALPRAPIRPWRRDDPRARPGGERAQGFRALVRDDGGSGPSGARRDPGELVPLTPFVARLDRVLDALADPAPHVRRIARSCGADASGLGDAPAPAPARAAPARRRAGAHPRAGPDHRAALLGAIAEVEAWNSS
jgi:hypothetical protein